MYILRKLDFIINDDPDGEQVQYRLTYEVDKFGLQDNRVVYIITQNIGETIETKISEKELKEKYFNK
jgi:pyruvate-formate lyase